MKGALAVTKCLCNAGVGAKSKFVFQNSSVTGDSSEQVGLNIPLRFIFKPSYSPHCINTNVMSRPEIGLHELTCKHYEKIR